jgi:hypothetical protein
VDVYGLFFCVFLTEFLCRGGSNTGAIVGGVVGGVTFLACLILVLFFYRRRQGHRKRVKERPVDLLHDDEYEEDDHRRNSNHHHQTQQQLEYYTPEPFLVPDPTSHSDAASATGFTSPSGGRPISGTSFTHSDAPDLLGSGSAYGVGGYGWAGGSTTTSNSRKGAMRMRPVNIVQHEDAGPPPSNGAGGQEEAETIELPPAYTAVQRRVDNGAERSPSPLAAGESNTTPIAAPAAALTATHPTTGNATVSGAETGRQ